MDFNYGYDIYENRQKYSCCECKEFSNKSYDNGEHIWLCKEHLDIKLNNHKKALNLEVYERKINNENTKAIILRMIIPVLLLY